MNGSPDNETRFIAIANTQHTARELFNGFVVSGNGDVRVGSVDIHPKEIGPALARAVAAMNDYLETQKTKPSKPTRAIIFGYGKLPKDRGTSDLERLGVWLYTSPETLDVRIQLLETVVQSMRNVPLPRPR